MNRSEEKKRIKENKHDRREVKGREEKEINRTEVKRLDRGWEREKGREERER